MGVCCALHSGARRWMMANVNAIKRGLSHRLGYFNLWITRSVRKKLLWALRYANVHSDVDIFRNSVGSARKRPISKRQLSLIVPVPRCADFVHFTGVTGRLSSCGR